MGMFAPDGGEDPEHFFLSGLILCREKLRGFRWILRGEQLFHLIEKEHQCSPLHAIFDDSCRMF